MRGEVGSGSNGGGRVVELLRSIQRWHTVYPCLEGVRKAIVRRLNDRLRTADLEAGVALSLPYALPQ